MSEGPGLDLGAAATRAQASAVVPGAPSNERTENMTWGGPDSVPPAASQRPEPVRENVSWWDRVRGRGTSPASEPQPVINPPVTPNTNTGGLGRRIDEDELDERLALEAGRDVYESKGRNRITQGLRDWWNANKPSERHGGGAALGVTAGAALQLGADFTDMWLASKGINPMVGLSVRAGLPVVLQGLNVVAHYSKMRAISSGDVQAWEAVYQRHGKLSSIVGSMAFGSTATAVVSGISSVTTGESLGGHLADITAGPRATAGDWVHGVFNNIFHEAPAVDQVAATVTPTPEPTVTATPTTENPPAPAAPAEHKTPLSEAFSVLRENSETSQLGTAPEEVLEANIAETKFNMAVAHYRVADLETQIAQLGSHDQTLDLASQIANGSGPDVIGQPYIESELGQGVASPTAQIDDLMKQLQDAQTLYHQEVARFDGFVDDFKEVVGAVPADNPLFNHPLGKMPADQPGTAAQERQEAQDIWNEEVKPLASGFVIETAEATTAFERDLSEFVSTHPDAPVETVDRMLHAINNIRTSGGSEPLTHEDIGFKIPPETPVAPSAASAPLVEPSSSITDTQPLTVTTGITATDQITNTGVITPTHPITGTEALTSTLHLPTGVTMESGDAGLTFNISTTHPISVSTVFEFVDPKVFPQDINADSTAWFVNFASQNTDLLKSLITDKKAVEALQSLSRGSADNETIQMLKEVIMNLQISGRVFIPWMR